MSGVLVRRRAAVVTGVAAGLITVLLIALMIVLDEEDRSGPMVRVEPGMVRGVTEDGVKSFRGVPYAAPPVGERRWAPPEPVAEWPSVLDATEYAPMCAQPVDYAYGAAQAPLEENSSEDCLYLNVNRPDDERRELPVLVWLHGGGFIQGTGSNAAYNRNGLISRGVITVAVNYRLGRFGFFAHPQLESDIANFGLLDQVAALEWVQQNIAAFGGDPDNVTVAGGSAGAMSVNALMTMDTTRGLFHRAIAQSGPTDSRARTISTLRAELGRRLPATSLLELRSLPASRLVDTTFNVFQGDAPVIDDVLPRRADTSFTQGRQAPVPYLIGNTEGEFEADAVRAAGFDPVAVRAELGGQSRPRLLRAYGRDDYERHVINDLLFAGPALRLARAQHSRANTYRYRFAEGAGGYSHGSDTRFLFGTASAPGEIALSDQVADYVVAFITSGAPVVPGLPVWPQASGTAMMEFTTAGPVPRQQDPWHHRLHVLDKVLG